MNYGHFPPADLNGFAEPGDRGPASLGTSMVTHACDRVFPSSMLTPSPGDSNLYDLGLNTQVEGTPPGSANGSARERREWLPQRV